MSTPERCPTVYYDGSCPVCRQEIGFYRRRKGADAIEWIDLGEQGEGGRLPANVPLERALGRLHLVSAQGDVMSGGKAFATLWSELPELRWFGRLMLLPPFSWLLEGIYRLHLGLRRAVRGRL